MSTRTQLAVYESEKSPVQNPADGVFIYRHSDGYPEGVVPDILEFLKKFNKARGIGDTSYCVARLIAQLSRVHCGEPSNADEVVGLGVDDVIHGDIEFFYHISPTAIRVLDVINANDVKTWKEIERYSLIELEVTQ